MDSCVDAQNRDECYTICISVLGVGYEICEALQTVESENGHDFIEGFHSVGKLRFQRLEPLDQRYHSHTNEQLAGHLTPEELAPEHQS